MGYELSIFTALAAYLFGISVRDIRCRKILNVTPMVVIMASPFLTDIPFTERVLGLIAVFVPMLIVNIYTNGFGMGDVKLCAAFGFVLGTIPEYIALILALSGAVVVGKIKKHKSLPLAPFICIASMAVILMEVILKC
ncbi:MAG: prepilin peptidase [Oscillospiraceae bacterium]